MSGYGDRDARAGMLNRRAFLRTAAIGAGATLLGACQAQAPTAARPAASPSGSGDWQQAWDALVAAAKQEGQLVIHGPPSPEARQQLPSTFRERFGIPVEYINVRTSELVPKMVSEKEAGLITIDVVITGMASFIDVLYPAGMVADLKPLLILPEVTDPANWKPEPSLYVDPEQKKLHRLFNTVSTLLAVNRDYVDPARIKTAEDLLRPEFRKQIVSDDPLVAGAGSIPPTYLLELFGEDYVRRLYGEQVVALRDPRQRADTLARGQYPVGLGPGLADVQILVDDGFHIEIVQLEDVPGYTSGAFGVLGVVEGAPHPKAGQLFANWLLSREGLAIYSRTQREVGMRNDINYAEWIPDFAIPKPGVHYLNTYTWEFKGQQQPAAQQKLRELLGGS